MAPAFAGVPTLLIFTMSIYGMGNFGAAMPVDPAKLELAETEMEVLQGLHQGILDGCREKCFVPYYTETDLTKGESACVDRCAAKFYKANIAVGEYMKRMQIPPEALTAPSLIKPSLGQHGTLE